MTGRIEPKQLLDRLEAAHRELLSQLEGLHALADALAAGRLDAASRASARALLDYFGEVALEHHVAEEHRVFPLLLASGEPDLVRTAHRLELDHGWLELEWRGIAPALDAASQGLPLAGLDALLLRIERFEALYIDHMMLEDALAYPQARARLDDAPGPAR